MSKFTRSADASHRLSLAAMEEASRVGLRTADIEHLLLALVIDRDRAGSVLRSHGLTLDATRAGIAAQHAAHLAVIGVSAQGPEAGRIVFHETDGYAWSDRAQRIFSRANGRGKAGDAVAVLRELLAEPSGFIDAVLTEVGASRAAIERDLAAPAPRTGAAARRGSSALAGTTEAFIPAPVAEVWALLSDPARMPEWQPSIASVSAHPEPAERPEPAAGGSAERGASVEHGRVWNARATTTRPDGSELKVGEAFRRLRAELLVHDPARRVSWRLAFPDAPQANTRAFDIRLSPEDGGTRLRIDFAWERPAGGARRGRLLGPLLGVLLRPAHRLLVWVQLSQLVSSISRAFR